MHWPAHGQTVAEKIYYSADALVAKTIVHKKSYLH